MKNILALDRFSLRLVVLGAVAALASACTMDKQSAPALSGPSEFALSLALTATPDILERDGSSQSVVTVTARDAQGKAVAGQRFVLSLEPTIGGDLSTGEVTTAADGRATFTYTAPSADQPVEKVLIGVTPVGTDSANGRTQTVAISLAGGATPVPSFTVTPAAPKRFELATFDASSTTLDGSECNSRCTYTWNFGNEGSATGQVVTYRFQQEGSYSVALTVVSADGVTVTVRKSLTVATATLPTAAFTFSPTDPAPGDTVHFNASSSLGANGASIVEYTWDFGNGATDTGATTSTAFSAERSYTVSLTVRDSNGLTATVSKTVSVATP